MLYLVESEFIETGAPPNPEFMEQIIISSVDALIKMEEEGRILGGGSPVGIKGGAFIIDAESNEALTRTLMSLPIWGVLDWNVTPMTSFKVLNEIHREQVEQLKAMVR